MWSPAAHLKLTALPVGCVSGKPEENERTTKSQGDWLTQGSRPGVEPGVQLGRSGKLDVDGVKPGVGGLGVTCMVSLGRD